MSKRHERESFETFYREVRDDLLLQTYALTGDLTAAERAVRDALVVAWHHWRKVSRLDDPGGWVRPLAWSRAQRRHTARWWHRQRDMPDDVRATLDALGTLTAVQRKALLLTVLTAQPLDDIAREVGLSRAALERELQLASTQFSLARDVGSTRIRPLVESMRSEVASSRWPRATILLRAGTARRRSHTTLGVVAAVAATVVAGSLVTDASGVSPDLASLGITAPERPAARADRTRAPAAVAARELTAELLLKPETIGATESGVWTSGTATRNADGDGLNILCQQARYADPQGTGTLVRTSTSPAADAPPGGAQRTVVQSVEVSATPAAATTAYDVARTWYGACTEPRVQLLATYDVTGVGDAASAVVLRSWTAPASTLVVAVARTGTVTTTVGSTVPGVGKPRLDDTAALLGSAVGQLCTLPGAGACGADPQLGDARPLPLASPALIGELDLPPVGTVDAPWAGTEAAAPTTNDAATRCDDSEFSGPAFSNAATRSFLVPTDPDLPPQFGLTETVGALPMAKAAAFVDTVRDELASCPDRDLGTDVTELDSADAARRAFSVWKLRVEVGPDKTVDYRMAILRSGTAVAQLGFIPAPGADMTDESFRALVARALQRLDALPDPA